MTLLTTITVQYDFADTYNSLLRFADTYNSVA